MDLFLSAAQEGLNSLVRQLLGIAQQRKSKSEFPLRIIDVMKSFVQSSMM